jgi:hypothetical protein
MNALRVSNLLKASPYVKEDNLPLNWGEQRPRNRLELASYAEVRCGVWWEREGKAAGRIMGRAVRTTKIKMMKVDSISFRLNPCLLSLPPITSQSVALAKSPGGFESLASLFGVAPIPCAWSIGENWASGVGKAYIWRCWRGWIMNMIICRA